MIDEIVVVGLGAAEEVVDAVKMPSAARPRPGVGRVLVQTRKKDSIQISGQSIDPIGKERRTGTKEGCGAVVWKKVIALITILDQFERILKRETCAVRRVIIIRPDRVRVQGGQESRQIDFIGTESLVTVKAARIRF